MLHMEHKDYKVDYKLEIVNELLKGPNHVRGIAKSLATNHMNISRKVKELSRENVVSVLIGMMFLESINNFL